MAKGSIQSTNADLTRSYIVEIFLVSFAALLLEISYTRIVSFKLFYYYTYLVIGLALLGIGSGGVLVALSGRLRRAPTDVVVLWSLVFGAVSIVVGYAIVAHVSINTLAIWSYGSHASFTNIARLLVICVAIFASFLAVGVILATLFGRQAQQIGRLYFADLVGAGLACAVVVALIGSIGPPATIVLAALVLAFAALHLAVREHVRWMAVGSVALVLVLAVLVAKPSLLPQQHDDATKVNLTSSNTTYSAWSPIFRVDAVKLGTDQLVLFHDGLLGSAIHAYNGNPATLTRFNTDPRKFPFNVPASPARNVLIIGAAGGNEVLTSLYYNAHHIDAVELNPVTYDLVTKKYASFDGHLAQNPRVNYVAGDGRSYMARTSRKYNLVWFPAPDSYSATNAAEAGAFVLSESYLYTVNAVEDSLDHLAPHGILATQFGEFDKPNRTLRYVATARQALADRGIHDPTRHILVASSGADVLGRSLTTILVQIAPFTPSEVQRFQATVSSIPGTSAQYAPNSSDPRNPVARLVQTPNSHLNEFFDSYPFTVRPITDNQPFFWHFTTYSDVIRNFGKPIDPKDFEEAIGERVLVLLLAIATLLAGIFLLLPFVTVRKTWAKLPRKGRSAAYFALLGFGFIFFEVTLIQKLTLFLGYPTYSLTVTLMSLLLFTGIGALLSERWKQRRVPLIPALSLAITALAVFYLFALGPLTNAFLSWPLAARVPFALLALAPLGLCLGMFLPLGIGAVAGITEFPREYVAWGWAVNGFASVVGSVLSTILAMAFGFQVVLAIALFLYLGALALLWSLLGSTEPTPEASPARSEPLTVPAS
jgi:hypothetical protein